MPQRPRQRKKRKRREEAPDCKGIKPNRQSGTKTETYKLGKNQVRQRLPSNMRHRPPNMRPIGGLAGIRTLPPAVQTIVVSLDQILDSLPGCIYYEVLKYILIYREPRCLYSTLKYVYTKASKVFFLSKQVGFFVIAVIRFALHQNAALFFRQFFLELVKAELVESSVVLRGQRRTRRNAVTVFAIGYCGHVEALIYWRRNRDDSLSWCEDRRVLPSGASSSS